MKKDNEIRKILVIRFSSIGDIVLTSPVVRALKTQLSGIELHFLTKEANASLLESNPYVDKVHILKKPLSETIEELRKEGFDYIADLQKNLRSQRIRLSLGVSSCSFNKLNIRKWLLVRFKWNLMPNKHIVDRYFEAVRQLNIRKDDKGLDFFIPNKDKVEIYSLPKDFQKGYVACVVGSQHQTKQMPEELIAQVCSRISAPIILLGAKADRNKAAIIEECLGERTYNACGEYNINQSASLVEQSLCILTSDTGLMHIAAALDKDIAAVWGNTVPEFGMYPFRGANAKGETQNFEVKDLSCRPCSKLGYAKCPKGHFKCMEKQNILLIAETLNRWIEKHNKERNQ